jgi:hypothetical protein
MGEFKCGQQNAGEALSWPARRRMTPGYCSANTGQARGLCMYPPPIGTLPITGFNIIAFGFIGSALIVGGLLFFRLSYFSRSRRDS